MRGVCAARASCHYDAGHDRRHLANHGDTDEIGDVDPGAETLQLYCADEGENRADESVDKCDDAERPGSGFAHALQYINGACARATGEGRSAPQCGFPHKRRNPHGYGPRIEIRLADARRQRRMGHRGIGGFRRARGCQSEQPSRRFRKAGVVDRHGLSAPRAG